MSMETSRPIGVNLKPEQREQILMWFKSGHTTLEIAKAFNVNKSTVNRLVVKAGLREPDTKAAKRFTDAEIAEIKQLYTTTYLSKQAIANRLGISFDSVQHHTKGLSREMPDYKKAAIAQMYLSGELTAAYLKEHEGITKKQLYAILREFLELDKKEDIYG